MGSFSYTPDASFSEKLTLLMPVLMWSLCYRLHASFSLDQFPPASFSLDQFPPASFAVSFIYIPDDDLFSEE